MFWKFQVGSSRWKRPKYNLSDKTLRVESAFTRRKESWEDVYTCQVRINYNCGCWAKWKSRSFKITLKTSVSRAWRWWYCTGIIVKGTFEQLTRYFIWHRKITCYLKFKSKAPFGLKNRTRFLAWIISNKKLTNLFNESMLIPWPLLLN